MPVTAILANCLLAAASTAAHAQALVVDEHEEDVSPRSILLPYAFYTETLSLVLGIGGGVSGHLQPQVKMFATGFATTNESAAAFASVFDYQLPFARRVFIDFIGSLAYYTDQRVYTGFNPAFPGEHAGSNDSSDENYIQGEGKDNWYDLKFKYLLPIGHGRHTLINTYTLRNGLLVDGRTGGDLWSPLRSGRTSFELSVFDRHRTVIDASGKNVGDSNGAIFALEYDNRDFFANPSKGSLQRFAVKKDFGINSTNDWSVVQLDVRKYFYLGHSEKLRQSVLALDYWTSYTPSWQVTVDSRGEYIDGLPPSTLGSTLGGFYRLRSYPVDRFSDKAAVYYSAELRLVPRWNPLWDVKLLKPLDIDWVMFVPFVEVGRVAPSWSLCELHQDMRTSLGFGLRFMAQKAVFRLDTAVSSDSWSMYAMVGHPF